MGKHLFVRAVTAGLAVAAGGVASASPFVQMDRQDEQSMAGGELLYTKLDTDADVTFVRLDGHLQVVQPTGLGLYVTVPVGYGDGDGADAVTALGNIEAGGIYAIHTSTEASVILHGGVLLPTAADDNDTAVGAVSGLLRVQDLYQWIPHGTSLRIAASPTFKSGKLFMRGDFGLDINLASAYSDTVDPAIHINAGIGGWVSPTFALMGELTTLHTTGDNDETTTNVCFGGRFNAGAVSPYFGLVVPLDEDLNDIIDFGVLFGLDAAL